METDNSNETKKATTIYKQTPVCKCFYVVSELNNILKDGYYEFPLGFDNIEWFVDEIMKTELKKIFLFKNTMKDNILTEKNKTNYRNIIIFQFCEKELNSQKVRD